MTSADNAVVVQVPPTINSLETVQEKKDMLAVLADIELAQQLKEKAKSKAKKQAVRCPRPCSSGCLSRSLDVSYACLAVGVQGGGARSPGRLALRGLGLRSGAHGSRQGAQGMDAVA